MTANEARELAIKSIIPSNKIETILANIKAEALIGGYYIEYGMKGHSSITIEKEDWNYLCNLGYTVSQRDLGLYIISW